MTASNAHIFLVKKETVKGALMVTSLDRPRIFASYVPYDILSVVTVTSFPIWQMRRLTQRAWDNPLVSRTSQPKVGGKAFP